MPTRRAIRSPQRSSGRGPAAIASSTVCGRSDDRHGDGADGRERRRSPSGSHAAADGDAGDARGLGPPRDAERGLAERRLGVDPALAGDDEVGARQLRVEVGRLHDEVDPGTKREGVESILDRQQARTRRRRRRRRPGVSRSRRPVARLELVGPARVALVELARPARAWRPSAGRRSRPPPSVRGAGS